MQKNQQLYLRQQYNAETNLSTLRMRATTD